MPPHGWHPGDVLMTTLYFIASAGGWHHPGFTDKKSEAHRGCKPTSFWFRSRRYMPRGSPMIGRGSVFLRGQAHRGTDTTPGGGCQGSASKSSDPSHTKRASSVLMGYEMAKWDPSGATRLCSHGDRCFHMWQLHSGIFKRSFYCYFFIMLPVTPTQVVYLHMRFLPSLCDLETYYPVL